MKLKNLWVLYLVASSYLTSSPLFLVHALRIIGTQTTLQVVNGQSRNLHETRFQCDHYDAALGLQNFTLSDNSGTTRVVSVRCSFPEYHYESDLVGYTPKFQYPVVTKVCRMNIPPNSSMLGTDLRPGDTLPATVGDMSDYTNGAARRLLSQETLSKFKEFISLPSNKERVMENVPEHARQDWEQALENADEQDLQAGRIGLVWQCV